MAFAVGTAGIQEKLSELELVKKQQARHISYEKQKKKARALVIKV